MTENSVIMETIRAFIAVALPEEVRQTLAGIAQELDALLPARAVRWVKPEALHLTLRFLGDTAVDQLPAISQAMDEATAGRAPFGLALDRLGCFPNRRRPRVIWVGLSGDAAALRQLKESLDRGLAPLGWPAEEKAFKPHLTLGRVKSSPQAVAELPWGSPAVPLPLPVAALHLIQSELRPAGPVYTIRHTSHLEQL